MNRSDRIYAFVFIFAALFIAYSPVVSTPYVFHDDVKFFLKTQTNAMIPDFYQNVFYGRPLGALRLSIYSFFINQPEDLIIFRFINLIVLTLSSWLIYLKLRQSCDSNIQALAISLIIFTLPPFQILAGFVGTCATPLALFLAILASVMYKKRLFSTLLLLASFLIYPPVAFFYWAMVAIRIFSFKKEFDNTQKENFEQFLIGIATLGIYCLLIWLVKPAFEDFTLPGYNPYNISFLDFHRIANISQETMINAVNFWNIFPDKIWTNIIFSLIFLASFLSLLRLKLSKNTPTHSFYSNLLPLSLLMILFFLSLTPYYASTIPAGFYRCLAPLSTIMVLIMLWAVRTFCLVLPKYFHTRMFTYFLLVAMITGIINSNKNLYYYRVLPSLTEFNFFKNTLNSFNIDQINNIHIVQPDISKLKVRYDEFGIPTSFFPHNVLAVVTILLKDIHRTSQLHSIEYNSELKLFTYIFVSPKNIKNVYRIHITHSSENSPNRSNLPPSTVVMNISDLYKPGQALYYLHK